MATDSRPRIIHGVVIAVLAVLAVVSARAAGASDGLLRVSFLNVGQGDAIFIQAPNGNQVLVDGGPDATVLGKLGAVMPVTDRDIDAVVVSHPHADHIAGLTEVLKRYEVGSVLQARETYRSGEFQQWRAVLAERNVSDVEARAGQRFDLGGGVTMTVLFPSDSWEGKETAAPHEANVTLMLRHGAVTMLLTGDMEGPAEQELVRQGADLDADVLKVGHHGSRTSTTELFLQAVTPQAAVIQVGARNRYGHPTPSVVDRLERSGISLYRTDTNGTVVIQSDGNAFRVTTEH